MPKMTQREAQIRNDKIRRLRGIAAQARGISMPLPARNKILMGVDQALEAYGADSEREHRKKALMESGLTEQEVEEIL